MERFDCAIIGTGPAGLSAAITLKLRNKSVLLLGNRNLSAKIKTDHPVKNYLGLPDATGKQLGIAFSNHLKSMNLSITEDNIKTVYAMGEYFALQGRENKYEAKSIILASGVSADKEIDGEQNYLGRGVSYCATCDGFFYKGKTIIVIIYSQEEEKEVLYLADIAAKVILFPIYAKNNEHISKDIKSKSNIDIIFETVTKINGGIKATGIETATNSYNADGIFILRDNVTVSSLVPGIEVEDKHIKTNRMMQTNIDGCFAAGDITGKPYQYIKAAGEGNIAALSAANFIDTNKEQSYGSSN